MNEVCLDGRHPKPAFCTGDQIKDHSLPPLRARFICVLLMRLSTPFCDKIWQMLSTTQNLKPLQRRLIIISCHVPGSNYSLTFDKQNPNKNLNLTPPLLTPLNTDIKECSRSNGIRQIRKPYLSIKYLRHEDEGGCSFTIYTIHIDVGIAWLIEAWIWVLLILLVKRKKSNLGTKKASLTDSCCIKTRKDKVQQ